VVIAAAGIASAEALGAPVVSVPGAAWDITGAGGIASEEAFGLPSVAVESPAQEAQPPSRGGFRVYEGPAPAAWLSLVAAPHAIAVAGIESAEAFGTPVITLGGNIAARRRRQDEEWLLLRRAA